MKKVYLVDDDIDLVSVTKIALQARGFEVESQYDDEDLVDNIRQFNPDAIILDVMFPDDNGAGFRMARSIRHHDDIKNKPIIMLTAVNRDGDFPGKFTDKDIDDIYLPVTRFIDKPVDPDKLAATINELTGK